VPLKDYWGIDMGGAVAPVQKKTTPTPAAPPSAAPTGSGAAGGPDLSVEQKAGKAKKDAFGVEQLGDISGSKILTTGETVNTKKKPTTTLLGQEL
jgi:hypothetical protein